MVWSWVGLDPLVRYKVESMQLFRLIRNPHEEGSAVRMDSPLFTRYRTDRYIALVSNFLLYSILIKLT